MTVLRKDLPNDAYDNDASPGYRRHVCLSCDIPPGYLPLVIETEVGLAVQRQSYPDHFLVQEAANRPQPAPVLVGWRCPSCGCIWGPYVSGCERCNAQAGG